MKIMKLLIFIVTSWTTLAFARDWWEYGNYYQVYPRSFRDSDGDGIGDLNGVTEKLQYLKDIGFTAIWLSPIFKSPMVDFGYDISDFYAIHPEYGTMDDFKNLLKKAKEIGMRVILDFVPNHTSDECEWFQKSVNREEGYEDFYVWHNGTVDENGNRQPPSNWKSAFRYSAWEWNEQRQQYYFHQFSIKQADLNYRNPLVVEKMKEVMRYWLDLGISGFRIDALPFMFEKGPDENGNFLDEPVIDDVSACPDPEDWCHLNHTYTQNQPESIEMVYQWRELTTQYKKDHGGETRLLLTEAYTTFENLMLYYGDGTRNGSMIPFNFYFMQNILKTTTAAEIKDLITRWLDTMPKDVLANWLLGNHDNPRYSTRLGEGRMDLFTILIQTLPGNAVTYYGEEIGMVNGKVTWEETVDTQGCNASPETYESYSRDPERTPYQWDASNKAGFTRGDHTWLPVASDYIHNNALSQLRAPRSHLLLFKKLIKLRQEPSMREGALNIQAILDDILIYSRYTSGSDMYVIVLNLGNKTQTFNINNYFNIGNEAEVICSSMQSKYIDGQIIDSTKFEAEPEVGIVLANK
ncbi:putative maltase H [Lucilia cuprina]|uniref:alpha-glucosidase n=1 Tax=Lucilia cuprina TaxID=7375 RepID=A0A0L0CIC8_LUCCU|nr:Maltase A1 [Lucilia cuprina]KNC32000.1 putative maltase H [Lucilia cuprina]